MKNTIFIILLLLAARALTAGQTEIASYRELTLMATTLPEAELGFTQGFKIPFLRGASPLTSDNNVDLSLTAKATPVTVSGAADAVWTPAAFLELSAGAKAMTGWNIYFFGSDLYGTGINRPGADGRAEHDGGAFDGALWHVYAAAALQMDAAAIVPGDWNHVVAKTYHEFSHKGYSRAEKHDSWYYENDDGENCNGFSYYGNFLLGYQMPIILDMVALLAEADLYLYDTPDRRRWGDGKIRWTFSILGNFAITERFGVALIVQCWTQRNYLEPNWKDLYYRNRTINESDPLRLEFYRVAAGLIYKF